MLHGESIEKNHFHCLKDEVIFIIITMVLCVILLITRYKNDMKVFIYIQTNDFFKTKNCLLTKTN